MKKLMWSMGKGSSVSREKSLNKDCYYPNCRKDAQCDCTMCMASIHATLDLRPSNNLFSSNFTNWSETPTTGGFRSPSSVAGGKENQWPNSEQSKNRPSTLPRQETKRALPSALKSTAKCGTKLFDSDAAEEPMPEKEIKIDENKKKGWFSRRIAVVFILFVLEFAVPWCLSGLFQPAFSADKLMGIAGESMVRTRLSDRLDFIARKIARVVPGQIDNCTASDSSWKLAQNGLMVHSRCILYSSIVEEVALWGCPTQTAGVIGRGIVDRSFTIMSGRMIEWYEGKPDYVVHQQGDSWIHAKWTASIVQIDGKTWILEYKPSATFQGGGLVSGAAHFLKWLICRIYENVKLNFVSFLLPKLNVPLTSGNFRAPT